MSKEADYALGYLAAKGIRCDGADPVGYLAGYLQFREDAGKAKCDPKSGWVRGPGGKCVRAKKGGSRKGALVAGGVLGAAALGGGLALAMGGKKKGKPEPTLESTGQTLKEARQSAERGAARRAASGAKTSAVVARQKARSMAEQAMQSRFPDSPRYKRRAISPTPFARRTPGSAGNPLPPKESKAPAVTPEAPQVKKRATRRKRSTQS
jgi:hypothetical protein